MSEPPVTVEAYHFSGGSNIPLARIVIHTTSPPGVKYPVASARGQARKTALYFTLPASGGSAHYVVDVASEEHCLRDNVIAHHAPPNRGSIGIEICGQPTYTRDQWLSADVWPAVERARVRARELAVRHKVPWVQVDAAALKLSKRGICGHVDVSQAFHQTDHTDPGPNFPWDRFMADAPPASEVKPMFSPPLSDIVASRKAPGGGVWLLGGSGAVYAIEGAPYAGGANGKPYFAGRHAARFDDLNQAEQAAGKIYVILSREQPGRYAYPE